MISQSRSTLNELYLAIKDHYDGYLPPLSDDLNDRFYWLAACGRLILPEYRFIWPQIKWWNDRWFNEYLRRFPEEELNAARHWDLVQLQRLVSVVPGDTAECGCYKGASSYLICSLSSVQTKWKRMHHVFDSFQGLSHPGEHDGLHWKRHDLAASEEEVARALDQFGESARLYRGWIPERFPEVSDKRFSFVHIDVDLYEPTRDSISFFYPRLNDGGILLCDDYGSSLCPGAVRAIDDFLADKPERMITLSSGSAFLIKGARFSEKMLPGAASDENPFRQREVKSFSLQEAVDEAEKQRLAERRRSAEELSQAAAREAKQEADSCERRASELSAGFKERELLLVRNNPKLFRLFVGFLSFLDHVPGLRTLRKIAVLSRRGELRDYVRYGILARIRARVSKVRFNFLAGIDLRGSFDTQWPEPKRFLPRRPLSRAAARGKPSVCLVTANMSAGGAERQVAILAVRLKKEGHDVRIRVLRLDGENGHYLDYLDAYGVDIAVPGTPSPKDVDFMKQKGVDFSLMAHLPEELRLEALSLAHDLLRRPADIVHCYLDWCCAYGGFSALLAGTPCIRFSWRNVNPSHFEFYRPWMRALYDFYRQFPRIRFENNTASGALDYERWLELPEGKIEIIPNGVDGEMLARSHAAAGRNRGIREELCETAGIDPKAPLIVSIGRLSPEKRPLDLAEVLFALRKNLPGAVMIHIGVGPMENALKEKMAASGLAGYPNPALSLLGRRTDGFEILSAAGAFLLTSAEEGMPNAVMEAMYAGLPVVATRVGGVPDLIEDKVHGFLHEVGDTAGMAVSLERLLTDSALRSTMGEAGRARILSGFTDRHLAGRVTAAYLKQCEWAKEHEAKQAGLIHGK